MSEQPSNPERSDPTSWLDRHGDALFRYAMIRLRSVDLAEEVVQESFVAALKARDRFAGESSERTWLIGILRHKIADLVRQRQREQDRREDSKSESAFEEFFNRHGLWRGEIRRWRGTPHHVLESREFWDVLRDCVSRLPARHADAFMLREMEELDAGEVCEVLDISSTNLWTMLHRARLELRRCLDAKWFGRKRRRR